MLIFMKRIILIIQYIGLITLMTACGESGNNAEGTAESKPELANKEQAAPSSGKFYDKNIRKQPCDLLTIDSVAAVAGVEVSAIEQRKVASMCLFSWEGGQASVGFLRTEKTAEAARQRFENSYSNQSEKEVAEAMAQINAQIEKQKEEGKTDVDPEHAKVVTGGLSGAFSGGFQFEDVPGLGDISRYETTKTETEFGGKTFVSYANSLHVLTGNLKFTVSFNREGDPEMYRDEGVALAEAVLELLSN